MKKRNENLLFICSLTVFIAVRIFYLFKTGFIIDGDEAVFGLMAKRISELKDFPIFMWKAHYGGTFSCYILAALYKVFSVNQYSLKLLMVLWETLAVFFFSLIFNRKRFYIPLFFAFLSPLILNFSTSFLGYVESILFGFMLLYLFKKVLNKGNKYLYFFTGFLNGFGLYSHPVFVPWFFASLYFIIKQNILKDSNKRIYIEFGFLAGFLPFIYYNIIHPFASVLRLGGRLVSKSSVDVHQYLLNLLGAFNISFGYNIIVLFVLLLILIHYHKSLKKNIIYDVILFLFIVSFAGFLISFEGSYSKARYLYPFYYSFVALSVIAFYHLYDIKKYFAVLFLSVYLFLGAVSFSKLGIDASSRNYNELISFLYRKDIKYCYSNYWISYPLMFYSDEKVTASPRLTDPAGFYDRAPDITDTVKKEQNKCLIFDDSMETYRNMLLRKLKLMNISYNEYYVSDKFDVFVFKYNGNDIDFLV
jgi:hypothetical protein